MATHLPVMVDRVVELLEPALLDRAEPPVLVDATLGAGGHSLAVLDRCPDARLVGLDRDPDALEIVRTRLAEHAERVTLVRAVYDELPDELSRLGVERAAAALFDLGVSSIQLDRTERGFSYSREAPLDMRMDPAGEVTAAQILNTASVRELTRILREYGEERFATRIANSVVAERAKTPFTTSERLVDVVRSAIPAPARRTGGNPAKRTFQALRIAVNDELAVLTRAIPAALSVLGPRARMVVLAYHSLEDRIVKRALAAATTADVPPGLPIVPEDRQPEFRLLTRGAERPTADEVELNPRAASARLRAVERVRP